ncbi:MAG: DUF421 domain-containing protein [Oscillospiraceae bacterium]|nr:DUF421 domain-containing protein [Oscillospiraceae bacterium]
MNVLGKTIILYFLVIACIRLMGKRQIGELQTSELVITLLISEVAAVPIQSDDRSIRSIIVPLLVLVLLEVIISFLNIKNKKIRYLLQGKPTIIISNGQLDKAALKRLRYSMDDVMEELRKKDIFDINEVEYAVTETDGTISALKKPDQREVTMGNFESSVARIVQKTNNKKQK